MRKYGYLAENADFIVADGKNEEEAKVSRIRDVPSVSQRTYKSYKRVRSSNQRQALEEVDGLTRY